MLSLIGEGSVPEYVIPTENRYRERALALRQQAGKDLGVPMFAEGYEPRRNEMAGYDGTSGGGYWIEPPWETFKKSAPGAGFLRFIEAFQGHWKYNNAVTKFFAMSSGAKMTYKMMGHPVEGTIFNMSQTLAPLIMSGIQTLFDLLKPRKVEAAESQRIAPTFNITVNTSPDSSALDIVEAVKTACRQVIDDMDNNSRRLGLE